MRVLATAVLLSTFFACGTEEDVPLADAGGDVADQDAVVDATPSLRTIAELREDCPFLEGIADVEQAHSIDSYGDPLVAYLHLPCSAGAFLEPFDISGIMGFYDADLSVIRQDFPRFSDFEPHDSWVKTGAAWTRVDAASPAGAESLVASAEWACVEELLRAESTIYDNTVQLVSQVPFNRDVVHPVLEALDGVETVSGSSNLTGDGGDLHIMWQTDARWYIFEEGVGDCPSGCSGSRYTWFSMAGSPILIHEWVTGYYHAPEDDDLPREWPANLDADWLGCERFDGEGVPRWPRSH